MSTTPPILLSIPDELLLEIRKLLSNSDLAVLTRVCKRFFDFFEPQLYRSPTSKALNTLAFMPEDRVPLVDPHPAQYVRNLSIGFTHSGVRDFAVSIAKALENIEKYTPGTLESMVWDSRNSRLSIGHTLTLGEMHAGLRLSTVSSITGLKIFSPFPSTICESSFQILNQLFLPSLRSLRFAFVEVQQPVDHDFICQILGHLPLRCPTLEHLELWLPSHISTSALKLQQIFDCETFVFPLLKEFSVICSGILFLLTTFIGHHPGLQELAFKVQDDNSLVDALYNSPKIPQLHHFHSSLLPVVSVCCSYTTSLQTLSLHSLGETFPLDSVLRQLEEALQSIPNLVKLSIDHPRHPLTDWNKSLLKTVVFTCPKLEHFECILNNTSEKRLSFIYRMIFYEKQKLRFLKFRLPRVQTPVKFQHIKTHHKAVTQVGGGRDLPVFRDIMIELCTHWDCPSVWSYLYQGKHNL
ncbi:hypothetical protein GYMLUDRAFT_236211 [Collybiopsis luxurians FD-317 M1]|nr:hypothetical protein GYMLUDRAFT_236211 [Collybiopsis luxurians FD-317 M1]